MANTRKSSRTQNRSALLQEQFVPDGYQDQAPTIVESTPAVQEPEEELFDGGLLHGPKPTDELDYQVAFAEARGGSRDAQKNLFFILKRIHTHEDGESGIYQVAKGAQARFNQEKEEGKATTDEVRANVSKFWYASEKAYQLKELAYLLSQGLKIREESWVRLTPHTIWKTSYMGRLSDYDLMDLVTGGPTSSVKSGSVTKVHHDRGIGSVRVPNFFTVTPRDNGFELAGNSTSVILSGDQVRRLLWQQGKDSEQKVPFNQECVMAASRTTNLTENGVTCVIPTHNAKGTQVRYSDIDGVVYEVHQPIRLSMEYGVYRMLAYSTQYAKDTRYTGEKSAKYPQGEYAFLAEVVTHCFGMARVPANQVEYEFANRYSHFLVKKEGAERDRMFEVGHELHGFTYEDMNDSTLFTAAWYRREAANANQVAQSLAAKGSTPTASGNPFLPEFGDNEFPDDLS